MPQHGWELMSGWHLASAAAAGLACTALLPVTCRTHAPTGGTAAKAADMMVDGPYGGTESWNRCSPIRTSVALRLAAGGEDARFIASLLLEAGRDVSGDGSPFGLRALMDAPSFQRRQLASVHRKVQKTTTSAKIHRLRRQKRPPAAVTAGSTAAATSTTVGGGCCLWIAEDKASGERLGSVGIMASRRGSALGIPGLQHSEAVGELVSFYVAKRHRRRGLGRLLLHHAMTWAEAQRYDALVLYVWRPLQAARALYRSAGFTVRLQSSSPADPEADDIMACSLPVQSVLPRGARAAAKR